MSKIISIGTAVPAFRHRQEDILPFMQHIYGLDESGRRKLRFLYHQSGIQSRYSVIADYSRPIREWKFYPPTENLDPFPAMEQRMQWYYKHAAPLSVDAIRNCMKHQHDPGIITHLITVSCTGMSAPGLDLQLVELLDLPKTVSRTSINFMGCYAAIHAMKMADAICQTHSEAAVMIVCTELCTLHFQREAVLDNITSSLLFGDGAAAALVVPDQYPLKGLRLGGFYSEILSKGKKDMAWELSSTGFQMTLSNYIPDLIEEDFSPIIGRALDRYRLSYDSVNHWCIHPGGKKILEAACESLHLTHGSLDTGYEILKEYGNMSSPTILFVLKQIADQLDYKKTNTIFGAAFGPGLTIETFLAETVDE